MQGQRGPPGFKGLPGESGVKGEKVRDNAVELPPKRVIIHNASVQREQLPVVLLFLKLKSKSLYFILFNCLRVILGLVCLVHQGLPDHRGYPNQLKFQ